MQNKSIWESSLEKNYKSISSDIKCDIVIIGGGITGINIAYFLKDTEKDIILIEKDILGHGVSARSTAKITYLQGDMYAKIRKYKSKRDVSVYLNSQLHGIELLKSIIEKNKIECNLEKSDSYLFANEDKNIKIVKKTENFLKENNILTTVVDKLPNGVQVKYGFKVSNCYTFNPVKYINEIAKIIKDKIPIFEETKATSIKKTKEGYIVLANEYTITCKKVIVASNYPFFIFPYLFPLKSTLEKSYIKATVSPNLEFNAINVDKEIESYRYYKDSSNSYEIRLGSSHELFYNNDDIKNYNNIDYKKSQYCWSTRDVITKDYIPYIGNIKKDIYIATGYGTWGMINSFIAGELIEELIEKKNARYKYLYNPRRTMGLKCIIRYPSLMFKMSYSYIKGKVKPIKAWYSDKVEFDKIEKTKAFTYMAKGKKIKRVHANCPHMGCRLLFNEIDKRWECPCHGSTFDLDGKSIDGPSKKDIKL